MAFTSYAETQDYLFSLKAQGVRFGIDRMSLFSAALGHPERQVPVIHIAGTNGKGSTAAMVESILHTAGRRTGLYTSPHLIRLGERVQVDRVALTEREILEFTNELRPVAERLGETGEDLHPSFFEFMTAMAFMQFARRACDAAIVEVGLGGRLDATNVVQPTVTAITSIGLDHCEMLGDTVAKIAAEKAGILKPGVPVVMGRLPAEAEEVVRAAAARLGCPLLSVREVFGESLDAYPATNLEGDYQRWNAATATLIARCLPAAWGIDETVIAAGLRHADWPGRWQRVTVDDRLLVLDASHNPEGATVLDANLTRLRAETGRRPVVVTGTLGAARARPLLETICRHAAAIHLIVPHQSRACSHDELHALLPSGFSGPVYHSTLETIFPGGQHCTVESDGAPVVVTGSIYLLGEVMVRLEPQRGPEEGRLQDF